VRIPSPHIKPRRKPLPRINPFFPRLYRSLWCRRALPADRVWYRRCDAASTGGVVESAVPASSASGTAEPHRRHDAGTCPRSTHKLAGLRGTRVPFPWATALYYGLTLFQPAPWYPGPRCDPRPAPSVVRLTRPPRCGRSTSGLAVTFQPGRRSMSTRSSSPSTATTTHLPSYPALVAWAPRRRR